MMLQNETGLPLKNSDFSLIFLTFASFPYPFTGPKVNHTRKYLVLLMKERICSSPLRVASNKDGDKNFYAWIIFPEIISFSFDWHRFII